MTGQQWFFKSKLVEIAITTCQHYSPKVIIQRGVPVFCSVRDISIGQPFGKIEQGLVSCKFSEIITKEKILYEVAGNTLSYLAAEIIMIAIIIHYHFVVHQFGNSTGILPVNTDTDIGLLHFIIIIVDNNIDAAL